MNKIEHISIQGFRRLKSVELDLRPLTVMIGANGVGKTSFLDVLTLLAASADGKLGSKIVDVGGLHNLLTHRSAHSPTDVQGIWLQLNETVAIRLNVEFRLSAQRLVYDLDVRDTNFTHYIAYEQLMSYGLSSDKGTQYLSKDQDKIYYEINGVFVSPSWKYNQSETALSQTPKTLNIVEDARQFLASVNLFTPVNVSSRSPIRLPQPMRPVYLPGKDGEDLVSYLYTLRENYPNRFNAVEDTLAAAFPDFERLGFPPVAAGVLAMTWKDKNFTTPLYMNQLSEGTLRFLWLVSLLQSPDLPAITMIDEPEVSMHPELLNLLAQLLREASERSQIFVATHSDHLIRFLHPSEVLVMDSEDGYAKMTWADSMDIEHWLKDHSLDEIWHMGQIGGRA